MFSCGCLSASNVLFYVYQLDCTVNLKESMNFLGQKVQRLESAVTDLKEYQRFNFLPYLTLSTPYRIFISLYEFFMLVFSFTFPWFFIEVKRTVDKFMFGLHVVNLEISW